MAKFDWRRRAPRGWWRGSRHRWRAAANLALAGALGLVGALSGIWTGLELVAGIWALAAVVAASLWVARRLDGRLSPPRGLYYTGLALRDAGRLEDALLCWRGLAEQFGSSTRRDDRLLVVKALVDEGVLLGRLERHSEALARFDDAATRFSEMDDRRLERPRAVALLAKAAIFEAQAREHDAERVYKEVRARYPDLRLSTEAGSKSIVQIVDWRLRAVR